MRLSKLNCLRGRQRNTHPKSFSSPFSLARLTQQILRSLKILFGLSFWGYNFVENFTGAVGALDEYSMQNALDFIQTWTKLRLSFMLVRARENVASFFFRQIKIASRFSAINLCFVINVLNNKAIILLNLAEYRLILSNSAYGLVD